MRFLNNLFSNFLSGWKLDVVISFIYTFILLSIFLLIGYLINKLEQLQLNILAKTTGSKIAYFLCNRATFVGTVIHELSHAAFVILTGGRLIKVKLLEVSNNGTLGHVDFALCGPKWKQKCQLSIISCAPVFVGLFLNYILIKLVFFYSLGFWIELMLWYFIISILDHMSMSNVDIKNYLKGMIVVFPMTFCFVLFVQYFFIVH